MQPQNTIEVIQEGSGAVHWLVVAGVLAAILAVVIVVAVAALVPRRRE